MTEAHTMTGTTPQHDLGAHAGAVTGDSPPRTASLPPSLAQLTPIALIGTARASLPIPAPRGKFKALMDAGSTQLDAAQQVLRLAAMAATTRRAGARGLLHQVANPALTWPAAAAETQPVPAARIAISLPGQADQTLPVHGLLRWTLEAGSARLIHIVLQQLADQGYRLPNTLLPTALELARRNTAYRPLVLAVLGHTGSWLAAHNEAWAYAAQHEATADTAAKPAAANPAAADDRHTAAPDAADLWHCGSTERRQAWLRAQRRHDPAHARQLLSADFAAMPAKERADLLGCLAVGISDDDAAWLETLLKDRSRDVRQTAAQLLLHCPRSSFVTTACTRLAGLLRHERVLLFKRWHIDAPAAADPSWKLAAIDTERPKHESLGERAWWLYQCVRQVPLAWWQQHLSMDPAALLGWAIKTDWAEALLRGWFDVLMATAMPIPGQAVAPTDQDQVRWAEAMLDLAPEALLRRSPDSLLPLLPLPARERRWQVVLQAVQSGQQVSLGLLIAQILAGCPASQTLSAKLSAQLAQAVHASLASTEPLTQYGLRDLIVELLTALHPDVAATLIRRDDATHAQTLDRMYTELEQTRLSLLAVRALPPT